MKDSDIIALFWQRDETAIKETQKQYGNYCTAIADRILGNFEDAQECLNDTLLRAWNSIPPEKPRSLALYLGTIIRRIAISKYRSIHQQKRGNGELHTILEEIESSLFSQDDPETEVLQKELTEKIKSFLQTIPERERNVFLSRYFYAYSVTEIAQACRLTETNVRSILSRTLTKLKKRLKKEAYL